MSQDNFAGQTLFSSEIPDEGTRMKIIGVGGAGNNAVDRLKVENLTQIDLAVVNTDSKTLSISPIEEKLMIGRSVTRGLSAGGEPEIGKKAAEADRHLLRKLVDGVDLVFLLAGLGGGTGSGASPVLAEEATDADAIVIAFVTMPFTSEGSRRRKQAEEALNELRGVCHAVIPLPNDVLLQQVDEEATLLDAFSLADQWIAKGVCAIWSLLCSQGLINVDFATLRQAFAKRGGKTLFGIGHGAGPKAVEEALKDLNLCPLLHLPDYRYVKKADSLILHIQGGTGLSMHAVNRILDVVGEKFGQKENVLMGASVDGECGDSLSICIIGATDFGPRRYGTSKVRKPVAREKVEMDAGVGAGMAPAMVEKQVERWEESAPSLSLSGEQPEFSFPGEEETRGIFDATEANTYDGVDLDVPTFLRRGIKISLS